METTRLRPEDRSPEVAGIRQQVLALVDPLEPATAAATSEPATIAATSKQLAALALHQVR